MHLHMGVLPPMLKVDIKMIYLVIQHLPAADLRNVLNNCNNFQFDYIGTMNFKLGEMILLYVYMNFAK